MTEEFNSIIKLESAARYLAEIKSVDEVKNIRDKAEAMRVYAKQAKLGLESQNYAAEIKLRAERRAGELLKEVERMSHSERALISHQPADTRPVSAYETALRENGLHPNTANNWQKVASLPEEKFESMIAETKDAGEELTTAAMTRAAIQYQRETMPEPPPAITPPFPQGKYRCIVIDPPWQVEKIDRDVRPNQSHYLDYPTMSLEEIAALPIGDFAYNDGCHLYLWVTQKYLPAGLNLMQHWGFNYQCAMTWVKPTGITPYSWMYNTELVLFGRRGSLQLERLGLKLSFEAPSEGHSIKPDIFYERVLQASPEPRLEMFSRRNRDGFEVWGNEV